MLTSISIWCMGNIWVFHTQESGSSPGIDYGTCNKICLCFIASVSINCIQTAT